MTSECPSAAAHISAVCPLRDSAALTFAPWAIRSSTASTLPAPAAIISAVSPSHRAALASAPAFSSLRTRTASPLAQARVRGVSPYSSATFTFAPAASRSSAVSAAPRCAAQPSAVAPSGWPAFTSAFWRISDATAFSSRLFTASTRRRSLAARHEAAMRKVAAANRILHVGQIIELARAVAKIIDGDTGLIQQIHQKIIQRRVLRIPEVAPALDPACGAADQNGRQIVVCMRIGVAEAAAVDDHRMVEEAAVAVGRRFHFLHQVGEGLDKMSVDLGDVVDLHRIVLVMGDGMVPV